MLILLVGLLGLLAIVALTYAAVYKIRPESFRISASIMKYASFSLEITSPNKSIDGMAGNSAEQKE
jgi:hypothetical protein